MLINVPFRQHWRQRLVLAVIVWTLVYFGSDSLGGLAMKFLCLGKARAKGYRPKEENVSTTRTDVDSFKWSGLDDERAHRSSTFSSVLGNRGYMKNINLPCIAGPYIFLR
jgi:hypothetical protein